MPRTGRPTTPIEQKRLRGTLRADRTPEPLHIIPAAVPSAVGEGPVAELLRATGAAAWIGATDLPLVHNAERVLADAMRLREALDDEFDKATFRAYLELLKEFRSCLSLLGLTPTDRSRLGVAEVKARSKLEELMDRRRATAAS